MIPVSMVVYWMMILWLKESDTCVNGGLLNDDTLIKTKWYLCQWWFIEYFDVIPLIKLKVIPVSMVVYWFIESDDDILI